MRWAEVTSAMCTEDSWYLARSLQGRVKVPRDFLQSEKCPVKTSNSTLINVKFLLEKMSQVERSFPAHADFVEQLAGASVEAVAARAALNHFSLVSQTNYSRLHCLHRRQPAVQRRVELAEELQLSFWWARKSAWIWVELASLIPFVADFCRWAEESLRWLESHSLCYLSPMIVHQFVSRLTFSDRLLWRCFLDDL